ncbi:peptide chain release factor N(5)-glutamine methyltransferase [Candidatus Sneabacter namystus]|uniref:peptide chain release factor N(5)-glutamine methyltransferase n=1 Tax=Candidatus Sneabacter namystus TaxID=2601646 RepID=A0A5C0UH19_9RICK|nr:peptide chain release factor N(5)-glutamine methyltransferase [Candidatus Sneabacter namystus]QEK39388.1 peptide chain release factor N(5)-glutamine methyltransferase [Candidatus Sneabacter namystus]
MPKTVSILHILKKKLRQANISSPETESRAILCHVSKMRYEKLLVENDIPQAHFDAALQAAKRRINGEPLAYILGKKEFFSLEFLVNPDVLIPRPETETLIEAALRKKNVISNILELGTGSGCIIITLLKNIPNAQGVGVDISQKALQVADINASLHKVHNRLTLLLSNWYSNLHSKQFDIIISNPPYIKKSETLDRTLTFEPAQALLSGTTGLESYKAIASCAKQFLKCTGSVFVEIGKGQDVEIKNIFEKEGFQIVNEFQDLASINRCLEFTSKKTF